MVEHLIEGLVQVAIIGTIGSLFVSWCGSARGIDRLIDPLYYKVLRRYEYVQKRNE